MIAGMRVAALQEFTWVLIGGLLCRGRCERAVRAGESHWARITGAPLSRDESRIALRREKGDNISMLPCRGGLEKGDLEAHPAQVRGSARKLKVSCWFGGGGWICRLPFGKRAIDPAPEGAFVIVSREAHFNLQLTAVALGFQEEGVDSRK
jgi:hypothetical protein